MALLWPHGVSTMLKQGSFCSCMQLIMHTEHAQASQQNNHKCRVHMQCSKLQPGGWVVDEDAAPQVEPDLGPLLQQGPEQRNDLQRLA